MAGDIFEVIVSMPNGSDRKLMMRQKAYRFLFQEAEKRDTSFYTLCSDLISRLLKDGKLRNGVLSFKVIKENLPVMEEA